MDSLYPSAEPLYFFASVSYPGFIQQIAIIFKDFPRTSFDFHGLHTTNAHHRFVHMYML